MITSFTILLICERKLKHHYVYKSENWKNKVIAFVLSPDHIQAGMQRLEEVSQTDKIPVFPLTDVWISKYTSVITCIALPTLVRWLGAHQCKIS